jgi:hypothetical protein
MKTDFLIEGCAVQVMRSVLGYHLYVRTKGWLCRDGVIRTNSTGQQSTFLSAEEACAAGKASILTLEELEDMEVEGW